MSDLSQVAVYSESADIYKNVFCNPAFELEGEREERVEGYRTSSSTPEPVKPSVSDPGWGPLGVCVTRLRAPGCGWGAVVVSAAAVLVLAALGLALVLILQRELLMLHRPSSVRTGTPSRVSDADVKGQETEDRSLSTRAPDLLSAADAGSQICPTTSADRGRVESTASPRPAKIPPSSETRESSQRPQAWCFRRVH
ncbi:unnamed protein product [Tetraodon nigroviridis]|uniref:(spotted green pufferfish) hypothetical protein n=1 Tax=Tetraodon nigroviridis TaxID=99883 RepID=Q4RYT1_TETNG|nr:unnamed protein product [Tetraodon nigroviridis]